MGTWHKGLDRTGSTATFTQRVAQNFNWKKRNVLGSLAQLDAHNTYWIARHPDWDATSDARKGQYDRIRELEKEYKRVGKAFIEAIEAYHNLPKSKIDEKTGRLTRAARRQKALPSAEISASP